MTKFLLGLFVGWILFSNDTYACDVVQDEHEEITIEVRAL